MFYVAEGVDNLDVLGMVIDKYLRRKEKENNKPAWIYRSHDKSKRTFSNSESSIQPL